MAVRSGFFNSIGGDRIYDARFFAGYFATFIGNGVFPNPSTGLQVTAGQNLTTVVKPGKGWINGYYLFNDSDFILQHDIADGVLKRVDRVVMKLDFLTREINIYVKKGTFASNPVGPTLQRDLDAYELSLADVLINNGEIQISQARITDTRMNGNLCGIVSGLVNQVDTTTLYQQYETFWNSYRTQRSQDFEDLINNSQLTVDNQIANNQTALDNQINNNQTTLDNQTMMNQEQFDAWFANVQDVLSGDVAGNLLMLINENKGSIQVLYNSQNELQSNLQDVINSKGIPNGIASLDSSGQVPETQLMNAIDLIDRELPRVGETKIAEINLSSNASSVTFENLDLETYKELKIVCNYSLSLTARGLGIVYNDDTTNNYIYNGTVNNTNSGVNALNPQIPLTYATSSVSHNNSFFISKIKNYNVNVSGIINSTGNVDTKNSSTINGFWEKKELINKITISAITSSAALNVGTKIELYGVKRDV